LSIRQSTLTFLLLLGACDGSAAAHPPDLGDAGGSQEASTANESGTEAGREGGAGAGGAIDGGSTAGVDLDAPASSMVLISQGAPAFSSTGASGLGMPALANDLDPGTSWAPGTEPAWLAYDLSAVPVAQRGAVLVVWNAQHTGDYLLDAVGDPGQQRPLDYTIETNTAPGGGDAPSSGWTVLEQVSDCDRGTVQHAVGLAGANWLRMNITRSSSQATGPAVEIDVYSTPRGATDSWMFMGDSITHMTMMFAFSDLPRLVAQRAPGRFPAVIDAAIGGTNTATALLAIDDTLKGFPGKYVVLAYGTNDSAGDSFHMKELVERVIAADKIPVVPRMPWSEGSPQGVAINQQIDALYEQFPRILRGPDLWAAFEGRTDLIPSGDIHPNDAGRAELRKQWANVMSAVP